MPFFSKFEVSGRFLQQGRENQKHSFPC